ncbi:MAG: bifunctional metallophosphatase/5'-nucleotidase [Rectinema subterraneum]|uniref:bifunctional metallophosphatase/5'-nucleotidase n=1 Tax=Rectinema subterraneum TaxID=2653714 RepID=UPI003C7CB50E
MLQRIGKFAVLVAAIFTLAFTGSLSAQGSLPNLPGNVQITFAHTNDMHGRIVESKDVIGFPKIYAAVQELKAKNPNTLLVDVGDTFHGLPVVNIDQGQTAVKLMNELGYAYMTTGNHDYNYGFARLLELAKMANFKILAANVYKDGQRVFPAYDIRDMGGVRVAFFGLATPETAYKTDPKGIQGVTFSDPIVEAKLVVAELAGKYDLLVCLSHLGVDDSSDPTSITLAKFVPQIDIILDGHSHTSLADIQKKNTTNTLITSTGAYGSGLGVVDVVIGPDRKVISKTARTITPQNSPDLKGDPRIATMLSDLVKAQDAVLSQVVGQTSVPLEGKREIVRTQQSNLGTLIANAMLYVTGADFALMNGGGIRDSIPAGNITLKQIYTVQPFGNYIQTGKVLGKEIDAILENGVGKLPAPDGRFPHLANLTYALDASKPAGDRVSDIKIGGVPVDPDKEYTIATLNFLFNGGDDYRMLVGKAKNDFPSDAEVFIAYLKHLGTVTNENMVYQK